MKTSTWIVLGVLGYLWLKSKNTNAAPAWQGPIDVQQPPVFIGPVQNTGGGTGGNPNPVVNGPIQWISCDDPAADPVMCAIMAAQQQNGYRILPG